MFTAFYLKLLFLLTFYVFGRKDTKQIKAEDQVGGVAFNLGEPSVMSQRELFFWIRDELHFRPEMILPIRKCQ